MKPRMLLTAISPTTNMGLRSYINSIFSQYIEVETCLAKEAGTALMEQFDLVLFASKTACSMLKPKLTPNIRHLTCIRTFNHTYLNRILTIPPNSDVYLVNDNEETTRAAINLLTSFGITQYHFIPYYPGCPSIDYSIQYAVTVGESRFVPHHILMVIDIGIRVANISTISEIAAFFKLPPSLADEVTKNYINQIIQTLKISNNQLSQAANAQYITQIIINNIHTAVCILDSRGCIIMINKPFLEELSIEKHRCVGERLSDIVPEAADELMGLPRQLPPFLTIQRSGHGAVTMTVQEIEDSNHEKLTLIHGCKNAGSFYSVSGPGDEKGTQTQKLTEKKNHTHYQFEDYLTCNSETLKTLETAKRISLTTFWVLIHGETGTGKEVLAQAIHNNSSRAPFPFIKLNLAALTAQQVLRELSPASEGGNGAIEKAANGTLYLDGIHCLTDELQRALMSILDTKLNIRIIASTDCSLYAMSQEMKFRSDLFYRISEVSLNTLPIRKRPEDIPMFFDYFLKNIFNNPSLKLKDICSDGLYRRLLTYPWPGNVREIENLCKYFYCVCSGSRLTTRNLPSYILENFKEKQERLAPLERQILTLIFQKPKIGRAKIYQLLQEQGVDVTEGKIRSTLQSLAEGNLIKMNRTKGGCEITDEGELLL